MPQTALQFRDQEPRAYARQNAGTLKMREVACHAVPLQEEQVEIESLRKYALWPVYFALDCLLTSDARLNERLSRYSPSVRDKIRRHREDAVKSSLPALHQDEATVTMATTDGLLDELRDILGATEAEALRQSRLQAEDDRDRIDHERQRVQDLESQLSRQKREALASESKHQETMDDLTKSLSVAESQLRDAQSLAEAERQRTQDVEAQLSRQKDEALASQSTHRKTTHDLATRLSAAETQLRKAQSSAEAERQRSESFQSQLSRRNDEALACDSKHQETTDNLSRRLSLAETQLRDAQSSVESERQRSKSLQSQLEGQKDEALTRFSTYDKTTANSRLQLENRESELLRCQSTIEDGVQRIKDLQCQLQFREKEDLSRSAVHEKAMDGLNTRLAAVKIELQRRQATIKHDRQRGRENDARLARHKEGYQRRLARYQQTTEDLQDMLWASQTEALRCRHTIRYGRQRLLEADKDVRRKNSSLRILRTNLRHLRSDRRKHLARSALLRARAFHILRRLAPTLASNKRLIDSLQASKAHVQEQLAEKNNRVHTLEFTVHQLEVQLAEKKSYISVLVPLEAKAVSQIAEKKEQIKSLESSKSLAESRLNEKDRQLEDAAAQWNDACAKMARFKRAVRNGQHARGELCRQRAALLALLGAMRGAIQPHRALLRANRGTIQHLSDRQDEAAVQIERSTQDMHNWILFTIVMYGVQACRIAYLYAENDELYDAMKSLTVSLAGFDRQTRELRSYSDWQECELASLRRRLHRAEEQLDATVNEAGVRRNGFLTSLREVHDYHNSTIAQTKERHRMELAEQQAHHKRLISSIQYQARYRGNLSLQIAKGIAFSLVQQLSEEHAADLREQDRRNTETNTTLKRFEDHTNQKMDKLSRENEELRADLMTLDRYDAEKVNNLLALKPYVCGLIQRIEELAAQYEEAEGKVEKLEDENEALRAELMTLDRRDTEKVNDVLKLKPYVCGLIRRIEELAAQYEEAEGKIEELTNKIRGA
ncbi:hypothetical protein KC355_g322 [Hortaea werneckii]|nr:hypothetical protein KC355_g322 [Hortaea werneckii]